MVNKQEFDVRDEQGSVLLWVIGLLIVALSATITMTAIADVVSRQRELQHVADSIALSSANRVNLTEFYETGDFGDITLWRSGVVAEIESQLAQSDPEIFLKSFSVNETSVTLTLSRIWRPPPLASSSRSVTLTATATVDVHPELG